jgi:hypothetical protein
LIDLIWGKDKPAFPSAKAFVHPLKYSGKSHQEKFQEIRKELGSNQVHGLVVSTLDEIACMFFLFFLIQFKISYVYMHFKLKTFLGLFNIRGADISFNPG